MHPLYRTYVRMATLATARVKKPARPTLPRSCSGSVRGVEPRSRLASSRKSRAVLFVPLGRSEPSRRRENRRSVARQRPTCPATVTSSRSRRGPISQGDRPDRNSWRSTRSRNSWMRSRKPASDVGPVAQAEDRLHKEHVLVDTSQGLSRHQGGAFHATHEQGLAWLLLEPLDRFPSRLAPARHSITTAQRAGHDVLLHVRVDGLGEPNLPLIHPARPRAHGRPPPRRLHHHRHPAK